MCVYVCVDRPQDAQDSEELRKTESPYRGIVITCHRAEEGFDEEGRCCTADTMIARCTVQRWRVHDRRRGRLARVRERAMCTYESVNYLKKDTPR